MAARVTEVGGIFLEAQKPRFRIAPRSAAQFAVHTGGFSESDAHAFNRQCGRVAASFQRAREAGASPR